MNKICSNGIVVSVVVAAFVVGLVTEQSQGVSHPEFKDEAPVLKGQISSVETNLPRRTLRSEPIEQLHSDNREVVVSQSGTLEELAAQGGIQLASFSESEREQLADLLEQERFGELAEKVGVNLDSLPPEELERYRNIVLRGEEESQELLEDTSAPVAKRGRNFSTDSKWEMSETNPYEELETQYREKNTLSPEEYQELRRERFEKYYSSTTTLGR